jgi:hypothetical protein
MAKKTPFFFLKQKRCCVNLVRIFVWPVCDVTSLQS